MSEAALLSPIINPMTSVFIQTLIRQIRAIDGFGAWDGKSDADLLEPFILDAEKRKALLMIDNPDPDVLSRVEQFYNAVALSIEGRSGVMVQSMMTMHPEGFGRMVLLGGRLVVVSKTLRDTHRFGFASLEKLQAEGEKLIAQGVEMIGRFPEAARYG
jgi:probable nitrogen fixation protein